MIAGYVSALNDRHCGKEGRAFFPQLLETAESVMEDRFRTDLEHAPVTPAEGAVLEFAPLQTHHTARTIGLGFLWLFLLASAAPVALADDARLFESRTLIRLPSWGVQQESWPLPWRERLPYLPPLSAPVAVGDFTGDGHADLVLGEMSPGGRIWLLVGTGRGEFLAPRDLSSQEAPSRRLLREGATTATALAAILPVDLEGDGDLDLYLLRWGRNEVWENTGSGRFASFETLHGHLCGLEDGGLALTGAFFDAEGDGDLDLCLANLADSPASRPRGTLTLFRNEAGSFVEEEDAIPPEDFGPAISICVADLNADHVPDIAAACLAGPLRLLFNSGRGTFDREEEDSTAVLHLGVDAADLDGDLRADIFITATGHPGGLVEPSEVRLSSAPGVDLSAALGLGRFLMPAQPRFCDMDNDGRVDLALARAVRRDYLPPAGWFGQWVDVREDSSGTAGGTEVAAPAGIAAVRFPGSDPRPEHPATAGASWRILRNLGSGWMEELSSQLLNPQQLESRGVVWLDADEDGRPDLLVCEREGDVRLFQNRNEGAGRGLTVQIRTRRANRMGLGADVYLRASQPGQEASVQVATVKAGCSDMGAAEGMVHFGLGQGRPLAAAVRWPHGGWQAVDLDSNEAGAPARGGRLEIREDSRRTRSDPPAWLRADLMRVPARGVASGPPAAEGDLFRLEAALLRDPTDFTHGWEYLRLCRERGLRFRPLAFFRGTDDGQAPFARGLQRFLACVNAMQGQTPNGNEMAELAAGSIYELERLRLLFPDTWLVEFSLGSSLLYWPPFFQELDHCVAAFQTCLRLQEGRNDSYLAETFVGLGDAYALRRDEVEARRTWQEGLRLFPGDRELTRRLALAAGEAEAFCQVERGMDRVPDARIAWIEDEVPRSPLRQERQALRENRPSAGDGRGSARDVGQFPTGPALSAHEENLWSAWRLLQQRARIEGPALPAAAPDPLPDESRLALHALSLDSVWPRFRRGMAYLEHGLTPEHLKRAEVDLSLVCQAVEAPVPKASGDPATDSSAAGAAEVVEALRQEMLRIVYCARGDVAIKLGGWRQAVQFYQRARAAVPGHFQHRLRDLLPLSRDPSELWSPRFRVLSGYPCE